MARAISTGALSRIRARIQQWESVTGRQITPAIVQGWIQAELTAEAGKAVQNRQLDIQAEQVDINRRATESDIEFRQRQLEFQERQEERAALDAQIQGGVGLISSGVSIFGLAKEAGLIGGGTTATGAVAGPATGTAAGGAGSGGSAAGSGLTTGSSTISGGGALGAQQTATTGTTATGAGGAGGLSGSASALQIGGAVVGGAGVGLAAGQAVRSAEGIETRNEISALPGGGTPMESRISRGRRLRARAKGAGAGLVGGAGVGFAAGGPIGAVIGGIAGGAVGGVEGGGGIPGFVSEDTQFDAAAFLTGDLITDDMLQDRPFMDQLSDPVDLENLIGFDPGDPFDLEDSIGFDPADPLDVTVICTELHRQGYMSEKMLELEYDFKRRYVNKNIYTGYRKMANPIVNLMRKSKSFTWLVSTIAMPWAYQMAHMVSSEEFKENKFGKFIMKIGFPLCNYIGSQKEVTKWQISLNR